MAGKGNSGAGPAMRIKLKGKNDAQMTATNRDGSTYKGPQVEFITIWDNEGRLGGKLAPDFGITFKGKPVPDHFINIYDERNSAESGGSRKGAPADDEDF